MHQRELSCKTGLEASGNEQCHCLQLHMFAWLSRSTLQYSNMACWKMDHLSMIFLLKPPFLGDVPLPCLITKGYLVPCGHQTWQGRTLLATSMIFEIQSIAPGAHLIENAAHAPNVWTPGIVFASERCHPSTDIHQWHRHPPVTAVTIKSGLDRSRVTGSMASSRLEDMARGPGVWRRWNERIPIKCCKWVVEDSWNMLKILQTSWS